MTFLPLLIVLLLALAVPLILARALRWMPVVVGEILVGLIIGRSVLNLIREDQTLDFLAEIGLAILMFLSGLEIDFSLLSGRPTQRRRQLKLLALSVFSFAATLLAAAWVGLSLVKRGLSEDPWMVALILSTTSLGVVVPVLKERGLSSGHFGQAVLLSALLADFLTMFLITIYVAVKSHGLTLNILLVGVLFVAALLAHRIGLATARRRPSILRKLAEHAVPSSQTRLQGAIALLIAFIILAKFIGTEMILGAFLAGAVLSLISRPEDKPMRQNLEALGFGFFIPIFFMTVGIRFNLPALLSNKGILTLTGLLMIAALAVKVVPALAFKFLFSWRETLAAGMLLSARLSLIIAASGIGLKMGLIDESMNAAFILIAAFTSTVAPLVSHSALAGQAGRAANRMVLIGAGDFGIQVARELRNHDVAVVFSESDSERALAAGRAGFEVIRTDGRTDILGGRTPEAVSGLIAVTPDDDQNLDISRRGFELGVRHVIAFVNDPRRIPEYTALGVKAFAPGLFRAPLLAMMALNPDLFDLLLSEKAGHQVREVGITNSRMEGRALKDLPMGGDALILSIRRGDGFLIPHGQTRLELDDKVIALGSAKSLRELAEILEKS